MQPAREASDALGTVQAAAGDTAFMGTEPVNQVEACAVCFTVV